MSWKSDGTWGCSICICRAEVSRNLTMELPQLCFLANPKTPKPVQLLLTRTLTVVVFRALAWANFRRLSFRHIVSVTEAVLHIAAIPVSNTFFSNFSAPPRDGLLPPRQVNINQLPHLLPLVEDCLLLDFALVLNGRNHDTLNVGKSFFGKTHNIWSCTIFEHTLGTFHQS